MLKAYKYRIYPTPEQKVLLAKSFGSARWFYNYALNLTSATYKETGKGLSRNNIIKLLPQLKKEYEWLAEPPSQILQQVALDLSSAFLNFFEKRAKYPQYKSKHRRQSIRFPQGCKLEGKYLILPKLKEVYCKVSRLPVGTLKSVTVSMTTTGQYYASCVYDNGKDKPQPSTKGLSVGINAGLTHLAVTSNGSKHGNPQYYRKYEQKLAAYQKRLSKKQLGSSNWTKVKIKIAHIHQKITRCREDFLHKLSRKLVDENQVIFVENLAVKQMVSNQTVAKSISVCAAIPLQDAMLLPQHHSIAAWEKFCTMLKYKAEWEGKVYMEVDRFFPSSQACHNCLSQINKLPLNTRNWQCPKCKIIHDRDINTAINIRNEGLRLLAVGHIATASRERVRPSKGTAFTRHLSVKEESPRL